MANRKSPSSPVLVHVADEILESPDGSPHGHPIQVSDEQQQSQQVSLCPSHNVMRRQESLEDGHQHERQRADSVRDSGIFPSLEQHQTPGARIFSTPRSVFMPGDPESGLPEEHSSQVTNQGPSENRTTLVTGHVVSTEYVSAECTSEAAAYISGILREDCHPVAISVLVCNNNFAKSVRNFTEADIALVAGPKHDYTTPKEPPFNAEKSCSLLKDTLESYGVMVISIVNRSQEFLSAILTNLASRDIPKSCQFLWFIFSGHGSGNSFSVNGKLVQFDYLIRKAAEISAIRHMAFFFDCCQLSNWEGIKVVDIPKEHMTVYSAPPNKFSFHQDGVGLMVTCLVEMLEGFDGSLSELQLKLREKLMSKMVDTLHIQSDDLDNFKKKHLPQHTSSMFDVNLYNEISSALKPLVSVQFADSNHEACLTVYSPQRIMHHPSRSKFELCNYKYVVETETGETIDLDMTAAEFSSECSYHVVKLPPQVCRLMGKLKVGAVYEDGRVEFSSPTKFEMPFYGKPSISSCAIEDNGCVVSVAYNPNIGVRESEAYHIDYIEIGFFDSSQWKALDRKEGFNYTQRCSVVLPLSLNEVQRKLKVAVKYKSCPDVIYSDPYAIVQPAITKPKITSVVHVDGLAGNLKFAPNQPSQHHKYRVCRYSIQSRLENNHWVEVYSKVVPQGVSLNREECVTFPLCLVEEGKECVYQVVMHYFNVDQEVKSEVRMIRLKPSGVPIITVTKTGLLGSTMTIRFTHPDSYTKDSTFRDQLKYEVVQKSISGSFEEVAICPSTDDSVEITGSLGSCIKVKAYYANREDLGIVSSEIYKSNEFYHRCCSFWNLLSGRTKCFMGLLFFFVILSALALYYGVHYPLPMDNQLIAVEQTIPFDLSKFSPLLWCYGALAKEYTVQFSDFSPGFEISAYLVDNLALKTEHFTIPSSKYPYANESIEFSNDEERYLLPVNYYHDPPYLLEGSVVTLRCIIDMPQSVDDLVYAIIHFFDSRDAAVQYQQWRVSSKPVHSINVTECAKDICTENYTIGKNSFYFPVFSTKANSKYLITADFTFEVFRYVDPSTLPNVLPVVNFSKNSSKEIPFHSSKTNLLYAHPPNVSAYERLAHLTFSCVPHYTVQVPIYLVLFIVEASVMGLCCGCWCWPKKRRGREESQSITDTEIPTTLGEQTPLLINT